MHARQMFYQLSYIPNPGVPLQLHRKETTFQFLGVVCSVNKMFLRAVTTEPQTTDIYIILT
jgi:hypothetical protein